jgi:hypothetical protein
MHHGHSVSVLNRAPAWPEPGEPPPALVAAASRPDRSGRALVLQADDQSVIAVTGGPAADATLIWAYLRQQLNEQKTGR